MHRIAYIIYIPCTVFGVLSIVWFYTIWEITRSWTCLFSYIYFSYFIPKIERDIMYQTNKSSFSYFGNVKSLSVYSPSLNTVIHTFWSVLHFWITPNHCNSRIYLSELNQIPVFQCPLRWLCVKNKWSICFIVPSNLEKVQ